MARWEKDWESYLVLHIDFSLTKYMELTDLTGQLNLFLHRWEKIYGKDEAEKTASQRQMCIRDRHHSESFRADRQAGCRAD